MADGLAHRGLPLDREARWGNVEEPSQRTRQTRDEGATTKTRHSEPKRWIKSHLWPVASNPARVFSLLAVADR